MNSAESATNSSRNTHCASKLQHGARKKESNEQQDKTRGTNSRLKREKNGNAVFA